MHRRTIQTTLPKLRYSTNTSFFSRPKAATAICKPRFNKPNTIKPFSTSTINKLSGYFDDMSLFPRYHSHSHNHGGGSAVSSPFWRLLEDPFFVPATTGTNSASGRTSVFQPKFDVHETPEAFVLDGEVAGITDKNALDIHFADQQTLVIHGRVEKIRRSSPDPEPEEKPSEPSASKKPTVEDEGEGESKEATQVATTSGETGGAVAKQSDNTPKHRVWVQERSVGEFQRSFNFPAGIDQDNVKATLKDGILTITVPKMVQKGKRKINVD